MAIENRPLVKAKTIALTAGVPVSLGEERVISCTISSDVTFGIGDETLQLGETNTVVLEAVKINNVTRRYLLDDIYLLATATGTATVIYTIMSDEVEE